MSEGWSLREDNLWLGRRDLIPSDGLVTHFDPRMVLKISDMPTCGLELLDGKKQQLKLISSKK